MAASGKTPIQHLRSRTTGRTPTSVTVATSAVTASGSAILTFSSLPATVYVGMAIWATSDNTGAGTSYFPADTSVLVISGNVVTLNKAATAMVPINTTINFEQLREGELFINLEDNALQFGGYPQMEGQVNGSNLSPVDLIPSIKSNAGRALRVSDDGLRIIWGTVASSGGNVTAVWAGQATNPVTNVANQSSGILTNPTTMYGFSNLAATVSNVMQLPDMTWDVTLTDSTTITVGNILSNSAANLNLTRQVRVNLIRSTQVINVTSTIMGTTPWGSAGNITSSSIVRSNLGSSGIQETGFVGTDVTVLPYMQTRNLRGDYAAFGDASVDTGITPDGRNPTITLPTPTFPANTLATVVHQNQGGFGIALADRQDLNNAAAPPQTKDNGTYTAKDYSAWTSNNFTPYVDGTFYFRLNGQNGVWPSWTGTNRQFLVNDGVDVSWKPLPQSIQNLFIRTNNNTANTTNRGIYTGVDSWLRIAQNLPNPATGSPATTTNSVTPSNQDLVLDLIQYAPMPIESGGTGIDLRKSDNTYWDGTRLKENVAWAIPAYNTTATGEMSKILPPFLYSPNNQTDPSATTTYLLTYKGVQQIPTWSSSVQGLQLQGAALPATNMFTNANRPLRLEGLGRFGVWTGMNTYSSYVADGRIQSPTQVTDQDLTISGSTAAADSRLILTNVTTSKVSGQGIHSARFDSGLLTVNNGQGTSFSQVAEDYVTGSSTSITTDFTNAAVFIANVAPNNGTVANISLNHSSGAGRGSIAQFLAGGAKGISGVVFFTVAATANVAKLSINVTTSGGLGTPILLRPLAGMVQGQFVALSWWSNGSQCIITVAAGD